MHAASGRLRARLRHTESLLDASRLKALELEFELIAYGIPRPWEEQHSIFSSSSVNQRPTQSRLGPWPDAHPPSRLQSSSSSSTSVLPSGVMSPTPSASTTGGSPSHSPGMTSSNNGQGGYAFPVEPTGPGARPGRSVNNTSEPVSMLSAETAARAAALHAERLGWYADCGYFDDEREERVPLDPDEDGGGGRGDGGASSFHDQSSARSTANPIERSSATSVGREEAHEGAHEGRITRVSQITRAEARAAAAAAALGARMEAWLEEKYEWDETTGELVSLPPLEIVSFSPHLQDVSHRHCHIIHVAFIFLAR